jgi:hypothetical protein
MRYGLAEHNEIMRALARERGWILIDADREFPSLPGYSAGRSSSTWCTRRRMGTARRRPSRALLPYL